MSQPDYWRFSYNTVLMVLENYREISTGAALNTCSNCIKPDSECLKCSYRFVKKENREVQRTDGDPHARGENSIMLAAEVARRVRRCGKDGSTVILRYGINGNDEPIPFERMVSERGYDADDLSSTINRVVNYCTGRVPRWIDRLDNDGNILHRGIEYRDWVHHGWQPKPRILPRHNVRVFRA